MRLLPFLHRQKDEAPRPASERDVLAAESEFTRKEKLVERFDFLPPEMKKAAKDSALHRFLEILFSHMRL